MAIYSPGNEPDKLKKKLDSFFARVDEYYPDKKVIGLHNEHKKLGERLTALYRELGYESGQAMLEAYGYEYIQKVREAKSDEQKREEQLALLEEIKKRINDDILYTSVSELKEAFPDLSKAITNSHISKQEFVDNGIITTNVYKIKAYRREKAYKAIDEIKNQLPENKVFLTVEQFKLEYPEIASHLKEEGITDEQLKNSGLIRHYCSVDEARTFLMEELNSRLNGSKLASLEALKEAFPELQSLITYSVLSKQQYEAAGIIEIDYDDSKSAKAVEKLQEEDNLLKNLRAATNGGKFWNYSVLKEQCPELVPLLSKHSLTKQKLIKLGFIRELTENTLQLMVLIGENVTEYSKLTQKIYGIQPSYYYCIPGGELGDAFKAIREPMRMLYNASPNGRIGKDMITDEIQSVLHENALILGYASVQDLVESYGFLFE